MFCDEMKAIYPRHYQVEERFRNSEEHLHNTTELLENQRKDVSLLVN